MPAAPRETVLCRYHYDPLDRLVDCAPSAEAGIQRFYCKSRLGTEIQGAVQRNVFQHDDQLLAQLRHEGSKVDTTLLATDQQRSVLTALDATRPHPIAYTPYGHRPAENGLLSLLGFNGERPDPVTGHYLLGNGYRAVNPVLMRFNSPDSLSPFGEGGVNAYSYCGGDPRNWADSTGHAPIPALTKAVNEYRRAKEILPKSQTSTATSKPITNPGLTGNISKAKNTIRAEKEHARRLELKELATLIKENESKLPTAEKHKYTWSEPSDNIEVTKQYYDNAKNLYRFKEKYPDTTIGVWYEGFLDVAAFDITIMHLHNEYLSSNKNRGPKKNHALSRDPVAVHRAEILRASYIKQYLGIDLMEIRQKPAH